ncbi:GDP-L-fucose synthase [Bosea sp. (in: a-proteobacteria)]|jgi:GDP-L-fucose synthase|uniref:GDP-L-fucose synthase n=1 Tax=Bosea sp. (in: a-proteobacteria) TaxID=1871050 RepID=UPI003F726AEC
MAIYSLTGKRIWVAGHRGMVGAAVVRALEARGDATIIKAGRDVVDLKDQAAVRSWMKREKPDAVILAAAKVGGILANATYPADYLYDNLMIEANVIEAAHREDVGKLLFLGSTCIYPKFAAQPINEDALLTGELEPTNEWYAIAKIAGIKLCQAYRKQYGRDFISAMPTNLYGPHDNFDLKSSHVLPALIRKVHDAKLSGGKVTIWGSGTPRREFMHVDDLASALVFIIENYSDHGHLNVGIGEDVTIRELAETAAKVVGYQGGFDYDSTKPDGTPRKCTDNTRLRGLGWAPRIGLEDGIADTYRWFLENWKEAA